MTLPRFLLDALALPDEASTASREIDALHLAVIATTFVGAAGVMALVTWFVVRYRRRLEGESTVRVESSGAREWLLGGGVFALFAAFWWVGYAQYIRLETPPADCMTVYVTAKQWTWKFTYDDGRSANDTLTVPLGRPIRLIMTSRDVIHSFYVPAFRLKQDVVPGRYVTFWFEATQAGDFDVFCAEYCGLSHSNMHGTVRVVSPDDYGRALADAEVDRSGENDLISRGARVAARRQCVACHTVDGQPHLAPTWAHLYGSVQTMTDGRRVVADEEYLTRAMMDPNADVVAGYKPVMPSYRGLLDPAETAALVAYIRRLRDGAPPSGITLPPFEPAPAANAVGGAP